MQRSVEPDDPGSDFAPWLNQGRQRRSPSRGGASGFLVAWDGIEPSTRGFSKHIRVHIGDIPNATTNKIKHLQRNHPLSFASDCRHLHLLAVHPRRKSCRKTPFATPPGWTPSLYGLAPRIANTRVRVQAAVAPGQLRRAGSKRQCLTWPAGCAATTLIAPMKTLTEPAA